VRVPWLLSTLMRMRRELGLEAGWCNARVAAYECLVTAAMQETRTVAGLEEHITAVMHLMRSHPPAWPGRIPRKGTDDLIAGTHLVRCRTAASFDGTSLERRGPRSRRLAVHDRRQLRTP